MEFITTGSTITNHFSTANYTPYRYSNDVSAIESSLFEPITLSRDYDVERIAKEAARDAIREFIKSVSDEKLEVDDEAFKDYARKLIGNQAN